MIFEVYGIAIDVVLLARLMALIMFIYVAWRITSLQRQINHVKALTEHNFSDLQIRLADAIGVAEESVTRDQKRDRT